MPPRMLLASSRARAVASMFSWIASSRSSTSSPIVSSDTGFFSPVSRRTSTPWFFSTSLGPISLPTGTPRSSHSEYDAPRHLEHAPALLVGAVDGHHHELRRREQRRDLEPLVVAVRHDHAADHAR